VPTTVVVIGRFKTSHSWALQNQPPLSGRYGGQFNNPQCLRVRSSAA
jgi:hypothetical protein